MGYQVIISGFCVFLTSMLLHVMVWRIFSPRSYFKALPAVFLAIPAAAVIAAASTPLFSLYLGFMDGVDWLAAFFLHLSLAAAYIMTYPALQANSPSLVMILHIEASMPEGLTSGELGGLFDAQGLVGDRIEDLKTSGLIKVEGSRCAITPKGRALLAPFIILRRLLGLPAGLG
jgi:hypothetical protein